MQGDIVQFLFYLISHMLTMCGANSTQEAIGMAARDINTVLVIHNKAVLAVQHGTRTIYHIPYNGPYLSDNQCVLLGMLDNATIYKPIDRYVLRKIGVDI